ncbi:MAG: HEAT repeat domain-containing protein, partial [Planctomycetota bacterium]
MSSLCLLPGLLLAVGLSTTVPASPTEVLAPQDKKQNKKQGRSNKLALHLIGRWLHTYRQGKWQLTGRTLGSRPLGGKSLLRDTGFVADKERQQQPAAGGRRRALRYRTARDELRILLDLAARMESVNAAKAVLEVAAVGLDRRIKYTSDMIPHTIRDMGARHLRRMSSGRVREYLVAAANGEGGGPEGIKVAMQAAALRLLGDIRDGSYRKVLEGQLTHPDAIVRTAVAESLAEIGEASTIEKLATALEKETAPSAIMAMMRAVAEVYQPSPKRVHMDHLRRAVIAAGKLLGCTDSWATDLRIVDFLAKFRYRDNVDRLIELLERYVKEPGRVKSGRLSLQLRKAANDTLTALTGAFHPMNQPEKWREFWEREKDNIKVDEIAKNAAAKISQKGHTVVKSDFFGIPVKGSRVV